MTDFTANPRASATPERPWLGLRAYGPADAAYFYGRDTEIRELYERICSNPLTVLYGRSGLGKSSLLGAGLLPKLKVEGRRTALIRLRFDAEAPTLRAQMHAALALAMRESKWPEDQRLWALAHHRSSRELIELLRPVLVFDQFEEMFTLAEHTERREEAQALLSELSELVENRSPPDIDLDAYDQGGSALRVVLALREDYLHQLERHKRQLPALMRNRMELLELSGPNALQAVLEPGRKIMALPTRADDTHSQTIGSRTALIEPSVAKAIVRHVAGSMPDTPLEEIDAVPPLLSLLCAELNAARIEASAAQITQTQLYGQAEQVLERFYQRSFDGMPPGVRRAVEDLLIDNNGRIREASSRDTVLSEMRGHGVDGPERFLTMLVDGRLLTIEERAGAPRVELTHDLLVPMVSRSREQRGAQEKTETQRLESERQERIRLDIQQKKRMEIVATILLTLAVCLTLAIWQSLAQRDRARIAEDEARDLVRQAAERALGRAQEQIAANEPENAAAYLAESLGFEPRAAEDDAALAMQHLPSPNLRRIVELDGEIKIAAFSADGDRAITSTGNEVARILDLQVGGVIGSPLVHGGTIYAAAFSSDGKMVVTAGADQTARLWDAQSGMPIGAPLQHEGSVICAAFSPDGKQLVTASEDNAWIWDVQIGVEIARLPHDRPVFMATFSSDGSRVLTASADKTARIWNAQDGVASGTPFQHEQSVFAAAFSPDGRLVVTASADQFARIWDAHTGHLIGAPLKHEDWIRTVEFSPDGKRVLTASGDHTAKIWDSQTGALIGRPMRHGRAVISAAFLSGGRRVIAANAHAIYLWNAEQRAPIGTPLRHQGAVVAASLSRDAKWVVTSSTDETAQVWDFRTGVAIGFPLKHNALVFAAAFSHDGRKVITASADNTARIWNAQSGTAVSDPLRHAAGVTSAVFSPDGTRVATASFDNTARIWDAQSGEAIGRPMVHGSRVNSVYFNRDGTRVVTASSDNTARIWDAQTGEPIGGPLWHVDSVRRAVVSTNDRWIATASGDQTARIWDAGSGAGKGSPLRHNGRVVSVAFSPDSNRLVTASWDNKARIWDVETLSIVGTPLNHLDSVNDAVFSHDGARVLTASEDSTARIWNSNTGALIGGPLWHDNAVRTAVFSWDNAFVLTSSKDGTAKIWDARTSVSLGREIMSRDLVSISGRRVADNGQLAWLALPEWMELIDKVKAQADVGTTPKDELMRWHFADCSTRTISPFSRITVPQHIEREIDWVLKHPQTDNPDGPNYSPKILDDAYSLDPGHPLILLALSVFVERPETKALWKRLSFPRFDKDARLASRAAEILLIDHDPENARKAAELALTLPSATEDDISKARAVLAEINGAAQQ